MNTNLRHSSLLPCICSRALPVFLNQFELIHTFAHELTRKSFTVGTFIIGEFTVDGKALRCECQSEHVLSIHAQYLLAWDWLLAATGKHVPFHSHLMEAI